MKDDVNKLYEQNKIRCAAFLLEMYEKYGAEILEEKEEEDFPVKDSNNFVDKE